MGQRPDETIECWTAKRRAVLVLRVLKGETSVADVLHPFVKPSVTESCVLNVEMGPAFTDGELSLNQKTRFV